MFTTCKRSETAFDYTSAIKTLFRKPSVSSQPPHWPTKLIFTFILATKLFCLFRQEGCKDTGTKNHGFLQGGTDILEPQSYYFLDATPTATQAGLFMVIM